MSTCSKCQRDILTGALFCAACGAPVVPEEEQAADPFVGKTFRGTYFVQQRIGSGGMGQVYKAIHVTLDVPVALKILRRSLLDDPAIVQRFYREARSASRLRHPNVISVTDFGQTDDGTLFMVMEFVAGKSLARIIADEFPIPESRIVRIASQVLAALAEAHANQILHRDLKPENVMVESRRDERDVVKVVDFGIAKIQVPGDAPGLTLTQQGLVCGTPGYMSPEQWTGEDLDARSDLYAVGVIMYEMLTGKLPFNARTPMEVMRKHLTETPPPPSTRRLDGAVSADLESLVMRTISSQRDDRPVSADEMRSELLACALLPSPSGREAAPEPQETVVLPRRATPRGSPTPRSSTPVPPAPTAETLERMPTPARPSSPRVSPPRAFPAATPERSRIPVVAVIAALIFVAAAGGVYFLSRESKRPATPVPVAAAAPAGLSVAAPPEARPPPEAQKPPEPARTVDPVPAPSPEPSPPAAPAAKVVPAPVQEPPPPPVAAAPAPSPARAKTPPDRQRPSPTVKAPAKAPEVAVSPPAKPRPLYCVARITQNQAPPASSGYGMLQISVDPYGEIFIEGERQGESPQECQIAAGEYRVQVSHPERGSIQRTCVVVAGERRRCALVYAER